ncbi:DNA damage-inducible protein 1 [Podila humilis]|nr:DNA damage-inducible protein 1 [Podila humilis]
MRVSILTESGDLHQLELDSQMEIENIKALLEADCNIPADEQLLFYNEKELADPKSTLEAHSVAQDDILTLRRKAKKQRTAVTSIPAQAGAGATAGGPSVHPGQIHASGGDPHNAEQIRQHVLSDPALLRQLRETQPELANAAQNDPNRFHELIREIEVQRRTAEMTRMQHINQLNADPFDMEAQAKIAEAIRLENVAANMEAAMEHNPEAFGRVTMLYIDVEVNGHPVKAFVDSGAQATIMSPECAEACGIMRLVDKRFAGIARGVGVAKILGRVHSAQIRVGKDLFLACSFTIMEGKGVDLLFGLDMLKRHQASIDLKKDALIINGTEIRFLSEHELPSSAKETSELTPEELASIGQAPPKATETAVSSLPNAAASSSSSSSPAPAPAPAPVTAPIPAAATLSAPVAAVATPAQPTSAAAAPSYPQADIKTLTDLGASPTEAINALQAAEGNVELAANILFQ